DRFSAQHSTNGVHRGGWQLGEVGQGAVLDLAALAVGLANQHRAVLPASLPAGHSGYMHRTRGAPWHIRIVAVLSPNVKSINGYIGRAASTRIKINSRQELRSSQPGQAGTGETGRGRAPDGDTPETRAPGR